MGRLDIEPLSERQWARVERELFDRVDQSASNAGPQAQQAHHEGPGAWRTAVALMLAGAAAALGGAATWHVVGAQRREAAAPSRITTDAAASHVNVGESTLQVAPRSTIAVFGDDTHGVTVMLERGRVECEIPPRRGRPPFAVEAGDVAVRVVGTHFGVTRAAADVEVDVQRGVVEVVEGGRRVDVHAGETWPPRAPLPGSTSVAAEPVPMPAPATPPGESTLPAAPAVVGPAASQPVVGPQSARERFESASRLEASHPDAAIAIYKELANKGGPWGVNALFAQGRLEADRGHVAEAHRLLGEYLARYPAGPNAEDARQLDQRLR
jgi:hypothetical protein